MLRSLVFGLVLAGSALAAGGVDRPPTKGKAPARTQDASPLARPVQAWAKISLQPLADGFERPLLVADPGDGSGRLFVVEQTGKVFILKGGARLPRPFMDLSDRLGSTRGEQGLLGLAFHPRFAENGLVFVGYTDEQRRDAYARVAASKADPDVADLGTFTKILAIDDPAGNHNGGHVVFGDDGALWLGTGDGGGANNVFKTAQDPDSLLGKMLRVDTDGRPVAGNAYDGKERGQKAVWAIGLRNPWRYSFDRATGDLWIADVGQNQWEEVHVVEKAARRPGLNFGWSRLEGAACFDARPCTSAGTVPAVFVYPHDQGCSITGGFVYRGRANPALVGTYVVGDYCTGRIWGVKKQGDGYVSAELLDTELSISSFGEDAQGELYVVDHQGAVLKLAP